MFDSPPAVMRTVTGEQISVQMEDGTMVELNTGTEIHAEYSVFERRIHMERGEAFFQIEKDISRPFVVYAGKGEIRALGTAFNVRIEGNSVFVSLLEGQVQVMSTEEAERGRGGSTSFDRILSPSEQVVYASAALNIRQVDLSAVTQWRTGRLRFDDTPLGEAIEEINRYRTQKLVLYDEALREEPINAYFKIGSIDSFLNALDEFLDIGAEYQRNQLVLKKNEFPTGVK